MKGEKKHKKKRQNKREKGTRTNLHWFMFGGVCCRDKVRVKDLGLDWIKENKVALMCFLPSLYSLFCVPFSFCFRSLLPFCSCVV